ncbi:MAG: beta-phosphoglucomutase [Clostridia bacterium]|nr:beta-phosphoglucomutase [Clostridia bacterium]
MKKGFIFDLDGVLCFTDIYHFKAWKVIADRLGLPFDEKVNDRLRGVSRMESLRIILSLGDKTYTDEEQLAMATEKNEIYRTLLNEMKPSDVSNEVRETLEELRNRGYKLSIGSSSKNTPTILEKTDLAKYFDAVSDGNNITHSKPDPEVFLKGAQFLGLEPSECYIVEDAEAGIDAGVAGGFTTIGIGPAAMYSKTHHPISTFKDLLNYAK